MSSPSPQPVPRHVITGAACLEPPISSDVPLDCTLSKPFIILDVVWNLAFVIVSVFVLLTTIRERPATPLRVWIGGYALLCLLHVGFVFFGCRRQRRGAGGAGVSPEGLGFSLRNNCIVKRLESMNTVISSIWWVFGFYWIVMGGQALLQDSPRLYWLAVVFLAFDVFFMILCVAMASVVFFTLFCCLPILATIAYAMKIGGGASEKDLKSLPRYKFNTNSLADIALPAEDSECCICLHKYVEGSELCSLPCKHHFHHKCICKWLRINATCPLCKFNILRDDSVLV